ncbi:hypothetical protein [Anaerotignum sp.]|uniref:hypothetical protein n=1 Tax=Anaerotignum sp. TaxID=2039241 RepID=UPI003334722B
MKDFRDRVPTKPNRYRVIPEDGGIESYVTIERADAPIVEGTPLNREALLNVQGYRSASTSINKSGNVTTVTITYPDKSSQVIKITEASSTRTTVLNTFTSVDGLQTIKQIIITSSGSTTNIEEVML